MGDRSHRVRRVDVRSSVSQSWAPLGIDPADTRARDSLLRFIKRVYAPLVNDYLLVRNVSDARDILRSGAFRKEFRQTCLENYQKLPKSIRDYEPDREKVVESVYDVLRYFIYHDASWRVHMELPQGAIKRKTPEETPEKTTPSAGAQSNKAPKTKVKSSSPPASSPISRQAVLRRASPRTPVPPRVSSRLSLRGTAPPPTDHSRDSATPASPPPGAPRVSRIPTMAANSSSPPASPPPRAPRVSRMPTMAANSSSPPASPPPRAPRVSRMPTMAANSSSPPASPPPRAPRVSRIPTMAANSSSTPATRRVTFNLPSGLSDSAPSASASASAAFAPPRPFVPSLVTPKTPQTKRPREEDQMGATGNPAKPKYPRLPRVQEVPRLPQPRVSPHSNLAGDPPGRQIETEENAEPTIAIPTESSSSKESTEQEEFTEQEESTEQEMPRPPAPRRPRPIKGTPEWEIEYQRRLIPLRFYNRGCDYDLLDEDWVMDSDPADPNYGLRDPARGSIFGTPEEPRYRRFPWERDPR